MEPMNLSKSSNEAEATTGVVSASLKIDDNHALIGVTVSQPCQVTIKLLYTGNVIFERTVDLSPGNGFVETTVVTYTHALLRRMGHSGRTMLYEPDVTLQVFDTATGERMIELIPAAP